MIFYFCEDYFCEEIQRDDLGKLRIIRDRDCRIYFCVVDLAKVLLYRQNKWIREKNRQHIRKFAIPNHSHNLVEMNFLDVEATYALIRHAGDSTVLDWLFGETCEEDEEAVHTQTNPDEDDSLTFSLETCRKLLNAAHSIIDSIEDLLRQKESETANEEVVTAFGEKD